MIVTITQRKFCFAEKAEIIASKQGSRKCAMRTLILLGLMVLTLGTVALDNAAIADDSTNSHLLPIVGSVTHCSAQSVGVLLRQHPR
jgi:hypothetical protein